MFNSEQHDTDQLSYVSTPGTFPQTVRQRCSSCRPHAQREPWARRNCTQPSDTVTTTCVLVSTHVALEINRKRYCGRLSHLQGSVCLVSHPVSLPPQPWSILWYQVPTAAYSNVLTFPDALPSHGWICSLLSLTYPDPVCFAQRHLACPGCSLPHCICAAMGTAAARPE